MEINLQLEIIDFAPVHKDTFKTMNLAWRESIGALAVGIERLDNPEAEILAKNGRVFLAQVGDTVVGSCALLVDDKQCQIADMAVLPAYQGKNIGKALLSHAINAAKKMNAKAVYLVSSTKLTKSLELYKTFGFKEVALDSTVSLYDGTDVKMSLNLK